MANETHCDVVVIGAGFAGMYALHRLRDDLGLSVRVFERGTGVGGTWFWNRYPGARCDVESMFYSYSFSEELQQEWEWTERYPAQPEILRYANHVADRFDLRRDIQFETSVAGAVFDEANDEWTVTLVGGEQVVAPYLISAVGCLSTSRVPEFDASGVFGGESYHTGQWPAGGVDFSGKRVAVIGTGSSGIQVIPQIAQQAQHLTVLQRTPNFSIPAHNHPLTAEQRQRVRDRYAELRDAARHSGGGVVNPPPVGAAKALTEEQRLAELERRWSAGGSSFLGAFSDTTLDEEANRYSVAFVHERIREIVKDPAVADLLCPTSFPIGAKRICVDTDYYATFNRDNVTLVSIADTPIETITSTGMRVGGQDLEFDVIVYATGYDAMTGALLSMDIRGVGGFSLRDAWAHGPHTYLGLASAGFPNLFMITGPGSPSVLSNVIVSIEQHVDWLTDLISHVRREGIPRVEAEPDAQQRWVEHVNAVASRTLYMKAASWYLGANVPGKPRVFMPYAGGVGSYRQLCDEVAADGYRGFTLVPAAVPQPA